MSVPVHAGMRMDESGQKIQPPERQHLGVVA